MNGEAHWLDELLPVEDNPDDPDEPFVVISVGGGGIMSTAQAITVSRSNRRRSTVSSTAPNRR